MMFVLVVRLNERDEKMVNNLLTKKNKKVICIDLMILSWLAVKLVVDVVAFIFLIWRLRTTPTSADLSILGWLATKLVVNTGTLIFLIWRLRHHQPHIGDTDESN